MKHIHTFENFINETAAQGGGLAYWKDYEKGHHSSPSWMSKLVNNEREVKKLVDKCIDHWNDNADTPSDKVPAKSAEVIQTLASSYFEEFRNINGNIITAMIMQES
jgi:hypothetical protein